MRLKKERHDKAFLLKLLRTKSFIVRQALKTPLMYEIVLKSEKVYKCFVQDCTLGIQMCSTELLL